MGRTHREPPVTWRPLFIRDKRQQARRAKRGQIGLGSAACGVGLPDLRVNSQKKGSQPEPKLKSRERALSPAAWLSGAPGRLDRQHSAGFQLHRLALEGAADRFELVSQFKAGDAARQPVAALRFGPQGLRQTRRLGVWE